MAEQKVKVIIRIMPSADEIDATLPTKATAKQIVTKMMSDPNIKMNKKDHNGMPINYDLISKKSGKNLSEKNDSLEGAGVKENDVLLLAPSIIAG